MGQPVIVGVVNDRTKSIYWTSAFAKYNNAPNRGNYIGIHRDILSSTDNDAAFRTIVRYGEYDIANSIEQLKVEPGHTWLILNQSNTWYRYAINPDGTVDVMSEYDLSPISKQMFFNMLEDMGYVQVDMKERMFGRLPQGEARLLPGMILVIYDTRTHHVTLNKITTTSRPQHGGEMLRYEAIQIASSMGSFEDSSDNERVYARLDSRDRLVNGAGNFQHFLFVKEEF